METGSKRTQKKAGSPSYAFTAHCSHFLTNHGEQESSSCWSDAKLISTQSDSVGGASAPPLSRPVCCSSPNDRFWPKITSHFDATGVRHGDEADPGQLNLSVCFLSKETLKSAARAFAIAHIGR
jgi:hypothetical protein